MLGSCCCYCISSQDHVFLTLLSVTNPYFECNTSCTNLIRRSPMTRVFRISLFPLPRQLLCLVGEAFDDYSDDVCGAVINVRAKGDKIAIWTTDFEHKEAITHIGWAEETVVFKRVVGRIFLLAVF